MGHRNRKKCTHSFESEFFQFREIGIFVQYSSENRVGDINL